LSGLPTRRFVFEGFLPVQKKERRERLAALEREERTFILHEAPHKLKATLDDLIKSFGESRRIALCRELTKLNEEVMRTTLGKAVEYYSEHEPRGEYVLVIEGADASDIPNDTEAVSAEERVAYYIESGMSKKDAIKAAAKECSVSRNELYDKMLKIWASE